jgi:hypothetical protein
MPKEVRICRGVSCENSFTVYPSQNKKFCCPKCRYSDPSLAELLKSNITSRHNLSDIDVDEKRATCSVCGPVDIRERVEKRKFSESKSWRCRGAEKSRSWAMNYGLSREDVARLLDDQGGICAICPEDISDSFHVDHSHVSGEVRGLLCSNCNTGIGLLKDDPAVLRSAVEYLEKSLVVGGAI